MGFPILVRCHLYIESGPWWRARRNSTSSAKYFKQGIEIESLKLLHVALGWRTSMQNYKWFKRKISADSKLIIDNLLISLRSILCFVNRSIKMDISKTISYCQRSTSFMIWYTRQLIIWCYICTMRHNIDTQRLRLIKVCYEESTDLTIVFEIL